MDLEKNKFAKTTSVGPRFVDESGKVYGQLKVLGPSKSRMIHGSRVWFWWCQCECGKVVEKQGKLLRRKTRHSEDKFCSSQCVLYRRLAKGESAENHFFSRLKGKPKKGNFLSI